MFYLALALEDEGLAVVDDDVARKTARVYGVDYVGSPYILMRAIFVGLSRKQRLSKRLMTWFLLVGRAMWRATRRSLKFWTDWRKGVTNRLNIL